MAIKGVNPSYFAGLPSVQYDPKASKANPQYAQMLTQAMQNRAQATDRRRESDEDNAFKARSQDQQERRDRMSNEISKRNAAVNEAGEARLKGDQDIKNDHLKSVETERLLEALQKAKNASDDAAVEYFTDELVRRGFKGRQIQESPETFNQRDPSLRPPAPPGPPPPPDTSVYGESSEDFERNMAGAKPTPSAPPPDRSPLPPRSLAPTGRFPDAGEGAAAPPMKAAPPGPAPSAGPRPGTVTSPTEGIPFINKTQNMDWIEGKQPPLAAPARPPAPARPMASDDEQFYRDMDWHPPTEKELLDRAIAEVVQRETGALAAPSVVAPPAKPLLPGSRLRTRAVQSDQLLAPDDPLNKLVAP